MKIVYSGVKNDIITLTNKYSFLFHLFIPDPIKFFSEPLTHSSRLLQMPEHWLQKSQWPKLLRFFILELPPPLLLIDPWLLQKLSRALFDKSLPQLERELLLLQLLRFELEVLSDTRSTSLAMEFTDSDSVASGWLDVCDCDPGEIPSGVGEEDVFVTVVSQEDASASFILSSLSGDNLARNSFFPIKNESLFSYAEEGA